MKIGIATREDVEYWGGDLAAAFSVAEGLKSLGAEVVTYPNTSFTPPDCDLHLLTNIFCPQPCAAPLHQKKSPFGFLAFHLDVSNLQPMSGFVNGLTWILKKTSPTRTPFTIEHLRKAPHLVYQLSSFESPQLEKLYSVTSEASFIFTNSQKELQWVQQDFPVRCPVKRIFWDIPTFPNAPDNKILSFTGLQSKEFAIQIGRLSPRKNQLGTIVALKDHPIPLVFIATGDSSTKGSHSYYRDLCLTAAQNLRKAPTFFISPDLRTEKNGKCHMIQTPISPELIASCYQHAAVNVHPAFAENPGFTCLESVRMGVPTVASNTTSLPDYPKASPGWDETFGGWIRYCRPYDLAAIEQAVCDQLSYTGIPPIQHPIFQRTSVDLAKELLHELLLFFK